MDVGAGPGAASPKEALLGHGWDLRMGWASRVRSRRSGPRWREGYADRGPSGPSSSRRSSAARGTSIRRPMRHTGSSPRLRGLVGQRPGDAEPPGGFGQRVGQPLLAGRLRLCRRGCRSRTLLLHLGPPFLVPGPGVLTTPPGPLLAIPGWLDLLDDCGLSRGLAGTGAISASAAGRRNYRTGRSQDVLG